LERHGFYPAGGGRFTVAIEPANELSGFDLLERGRVESRAATAIVSNLPLHIAEREIDTVLRKLHWNRKEGSAGEVSSNGPGNAVFAEIRSKHVTELFADFGSKGVPAERVAGNVAKEAIEYLISDVPVGRHLADQLMLPLGISAWQPANDQRQRGGSFWTLSLTEHSRTHIEILRTFLGIAIDVEESGKRKPCIVHIAPE
jgi:RNA 3'-terminal phosphate cyclase (ATP)